ncbi:MAG TPA: trypsin-like peptidase domain-containing protein, partial [Spirochaetota bacterium]|nr:trypsin-like peptidase domain-containing protein [Spirochaetota bacterium]
IPAQVIGYDKVFDIALLKIQRKNTKPLILGRSDDIKVGDKIYTIGNPIGIKYTVTSGIISNKEIDFFQLGRAFQVDAAVNPGNSGGPLFDERGQVIGVIFAGVPQYQNINFAIPFQWVIKTIPLLYKGGEVKRCWTGGGLYNNKNKLEFYYILPGGSLSKSEIKVGDALNKIENVEVKTVEDAQYNLAWQRYPRLINLETERKGETLRKIARLEERPYLPIEIAFEKDTQGKLITLVYGLSLDYYDKNPFLKKYTVNKVYKRMLGSQVEIGEGDPIVVYDLKYVEKDKTILLTLKFKKKDVGFIDRVVTVPAYAEINSIF